MTALPARSSVSGTPSRATANAGFGAQYDFINERLAAGTASASEKAASRSALETARGMQPITAAVAASALTVTLNPTNLEFRHATLGNGTVNMRTVAAALNLVISSGSTLGTVSGVGSRVALLAIDNAGTVELAAVNANGNFHFDESQLISSTAEGGAGAADSANVVYSVTARSNVPFRFVGYVESTQATAGTWATSPSKIQGHGGCVLFAGAAGRSFIGTAQATTSGSSKVFPVPSWATEFTMSLAGCSSNGTGQLFGRIGDASGISSSGYVGASEGTGISTGFVLNGTASAPAGIYSGQVKFCLIDAATNTWSMAANISRSDTPATFASSGHKSLAGPLTQVAFETADTFDAGSCNVCGR